MEACLSVCLPACLPVCLSGPVCCFPRAPPAGLSSIVSPRPSAELVLPPERAGSTGSKRRASPVSPAALVGGYVGGDFDTFRSLRAPARPPAAAALATADARARSPAGCERAAGSACGRGASGAAPPEELSGGHWTARALHAARRGGRALAALLRRLHVAGSNRADFLLAAPLAPRPGPRISTHFPARGAGRRGPSGGSGFPEGNRPAESSAGSGVAGAARRALDPVSWVGAGFGFSYLLPRPARLGLHDAGSEDRRSGGARGGGWRRIRDWGEFEASDAWAEAEDASGPAQEGEAALPLDPDAVDARPRTRRFFVCRVSYLLLNWLLLLLGRVAGGALGMCVRALLACCKRALAQLAVLDLRHICLRVVNGVGRHAKPAGQWLQARLTVARGGGRAAVRREVTPAEPAEAAQ
jgi:hypothetical protein